MDISQRLIIAWATHRVTHLDRLPRYEDSYAVSQEFLNGQHQLMSTLKDLKLQHFKFQPLIRKTVPVNQLNS